MGCCISITNKDITIKDPIQQKSSIPGNEGEVDKSFEPTTTYADHKSSINQNHKLSGHTDSKFTNQRDSIHRVPSKINLGSINSCCYFFGVDTETTKRILKFDSKTEEFTHISAPENLPLYKMSSCTYISDTCIYITGGIDNEGKISNRVFAYNPEENAAEELGSFTHKRYAHQTVYFRDQLYVIGGLGQSDQKAKSGQENVLKSVERYNAKSKSWSQLEDLKFPRSSAIAIIYQDTIYVLGGYTGQTKRTRTIEKFNIKTTQWQVLLLKLPRGVESSFVFSPGPDHIQIIGGRDASGFVDINLVLDLSGDRYVPKKPMGLQREQVKGFLCREKVFLLGDDDKLTMKEYHFQEDKWEEKVSSFGIMANGIQLLSCSQPTLLVEHDPLTKVQLEAFSENKKAKKCMVFGDNQTNFILEVNFTTNQVIEHPIPTKLKLFAYQGIALLINGAYLLSGGINEQTGVISNKAYIYDPRNNSAKKLAKSYQTRHTFNLVTMDNCVYAIGGKSVKENKEVLLAECERYSFVTNSWEQIANMNYARSNAMTFYLKNNLYVIGGCKEGSGRLTKIEVYRSDANIWEVIKVELKVPLEGSGLILENKRGGIYLLGGKTDSGETDKVWDFDVEQGDMWEVANLKEAKELSKVYEFQETKVLVLGGSKVEFIDLREGKPIGDNDLLNQINRKLELIMDKGECNKKKLSGYGLA